MVDIVESVQQTYNFFYSFLSPVIGETYLQLFIFIVGLSVYAIFVWKFYKTLSKRDLFKIDMEKYNLPGIKHKTLGKAGSVIAYILKYGVIFPVYIFLWFVVLSFFLLVLTEDVAISHIILVSISVVSATRLISYYREDLSSDLAKLVPFALLAISLVDPNFFAVDTTIARLSEISNLWSDILQFLVFSIVLEWILRIIFLTKRGIIKRKNKTKIKSQEIKEELTFEN
jgi:hypothetical protein